MIRTVTIFDSCVGKRGSREACEILKSHTGLVLHSLSRVEMVTPTITIVRRKLIIGEHANMGPIESINMLASRNLEEL